MNLSVPVVFEYEDACKRVVAETSLVREDVETVLDYLCKVANRREIFFLWRPTLNDPKDEMVLELAVAANCGFIVTFNKRDFHGAEKFGIRVLTPNEFLKQIGEPP